MNSLRASQFSSGWVHPEKKTTVSLIEMYMYFSAQIFQCFTTKQNGKADALNKLLVMLPCMDAEIAAAAPYSNLFDSWVNKVDNSKLTFEQKMQFKQDLENCMYYGDKIIVSLCYIRYRMILWCASELKRTDEPSCSECKSLRAIYWSISVMGCSHITQMEIAYAIYKIISDITVYSNQTQALCKQGKMQEAAIVMENIISEIRGEYHALPVEEQWFPSIADAANEANIAPPKVKT